VVDGGGIAGFDAMTFISAAVRFILPTRRIMSAGAGAGVGGGGGDVDVDAARAVGEKDVYLVFGGKTGWIGCMVVDLLRGMGREVHVAESRLEAREDVER
jgi:hypothetical protein